MSGHPHPGRSGFTLIETVVAVAISSILLLTLGSSVLLASRAVPNGREPVLTVAQVQYAVALLRTDIELAIDFASEDEWILLAVPDRDGDGIPEVIEYRVTPSGQLVRVQNQGTSEVLIRGVKELDVDAVVTDGLLTAVEIKVAAESVLMPERTLLIRLLNTPEAR